MGTEVVTCPECGTTRVYYPSQVANLKSHLCKSCNQKAKWRKGTFDNVDWKTARRLRDKTIASAKEFDRNVYKV